MNGRHGFLLSICPSSCFQSFIFGGLLYDTFAFCFIVVATLFTICCDRWLITWALDGRLDWSVGGQAMTIYD